MTASSYFGAMFSKSLILSEIYIVSLTTKSKFVYPQDFFKVKFTYKFNNVDLKQTRIIDRK